MVNNFFTLWFLADGGSADPCDDPLSCVSIQVTGHYAVVFIKEDTLWSDVQYWITANRLNVFFQDSESKWVYGVWNDDSKSVTGAMGTSDVLACPYDVTGFAELPTMSIGVVCGKYIYI